MANSPCSEAHLNSALEAERALADDLVAWIEGIGIAMTKAEAERLDALLARYREARGR